MLAVLDELFPIAAASARRTLAEALARTGEPRGPRSIDEALAAGRTARWTSALVALCARAPIAAGAGDRDGATAALAEATALAADSPAGLVVRDLERTQRTPSPHRGTIVP